MFAWHQPKSLGTGQNNEQSFFWSTLFTLAAAVLYTWLYNNSRGSLLLVVLFHATQNTTGMFLPVEFAVPGGIVRNLLVVIYVVAAIGVVLSAGAAHLSRTESRQVEPSDALPPVAPRG